jgi:hypothetical protein
MEVWTIQLGQWRLAKAQGIFVLDTTAMSGIAAFAPDFHLVKLYKAGKITEEVYTAFYEEKMQESQLLYPKYWDHIQTKGKVALACYCAAGKFCHRHLLLPIVTAYYKKKDITVKYMGEIEKEKK